MSHYFKKIISDNSLGMMSLLGGAKFEEVAGKCTKCDAENLEMSRGISLRVYAGIFRCKSCGHTESTSMHLMKSSFPIQKMPEGALPFYLNNLEDEKDIKE